MNSLLTSLRTDFTDGINTIGNFVGINNMSLYFLVLFLFFFTIILLVYIKEIFLLIKFTLIY